MTNVGIIGFGTVGSGTARILSENREMIRVRTGADINLAAVSDLDIDRDRGVRLPDTVRLTKYAQDIIDDPNIDVVVELIGGISPAGDFIEAALSSGKHVVTANKALLAKEGTRLFAKAREAGRTLGFEASVAGGIPIIKALREGLAANNFRSIYGIINGTSNYILTMMSEKGQDFSEALADAKRLGYAEADPTFDIEGIDTAHKLTIVASLCYGIPLSLDSIYIEGISKITAQDIAFASELGYKIKLLAIARLLNNEIELRVHPTMIPADYLISKVDGVYNAIYVDGDSVGESLFYGKGAGDRPTGSAVVSDIIDIALGRNTISAIGERLNPQYVLKAIADIESLYYFRFTAIDMPGILSKISGVLGRFGISISSVIQKGRRQGGPVPLVVLTHLARENDVRAAINEIDGMSVVAARTMIIRVEGRD